MTNLWKFALKKKTVENIGVVFDCFGMALLAELKGLDQKMRPTEIVGLLPALKFPIVMVIEESDRVE